MSISTHQEYFLNKVVLGDITGRVALIEQLWAVLMVLSPGLKT